MGNTSEKIKLSPAMEKVIEGMRSTSPLHFSNTYMAYRQGGTSLNRKTIEKLEQIGLVFRGELEYTNTQNGRSYWGFKMYLTELGKSIQL